MRILSLIAGLIVTVFSLAFILPNGVNAAGNTYYVSTTGNDTTGNGSSANPWKTVTKGVNTMTGGDTLKIRPGTYNETAGVRIKDDIDGTATQRTIIEPANPGDIVTVTFNTNVNYVLSLEADYSTVRNIIFDGLIPSNTAGVEDGANCVSVRPGSLDLNDATNIELDGITARNCNRFGISVGGSGSLKATNVTVKNSIVENSAMDNYNSAYTRNSYTGGWASGLKVSEGAQNILLENNTVRNNWGEGMAITKGINVEARNNTVYNNFSVEIYIDNANQVKVHKNFAYCINGGITKLDDNVAPEVYTKASGISVGEEEYPTWGNQAGNLSIYNNVIYNCSRGFTWYGTDANPATGGLENTVISNNTFYLTDNTSAAIYIEGEVQDGITFKNNIIRDAIGSGGVIVDSLGTYVFDNNYWINNQPDDELYPELTGPLDVVNDEASLQFFGAPGSTVSNFRIGANSLARNKGANLSQYTTDYLGNTRHAIYDLGAFEFIPTVTALINATPTTGAGNLLVSFDSTNSLENGTDIVEWEWDFGDGSDTQGTAVGTTSHTYNPGTYNATVTVRDGYGIEDVSDPIAITVNPPATPLLVANFSANVTNGYAPLSVNFTDTSTAYNTSVTTRAWDFNNDGTTDSTAQNPSYVYGAPGSYTVKLTIGNGTISDVETKTGYILVTPTPTLTAEFSSSTRVGNAPYVATFNNYSTAVNTTITTWTWNFGDGTTPVVSNNGSPIQHTYTVSGVYTVTLTVGNGSGITNAKTRTAYVTVLPTQNTTPQVMVLTPDGISGPEDQITENMTAYRILWYATDTNDVATVELYYDTNNSGNDGVRIATNNTLAEGFYNYYDWDPRTVAAGTYYIYAKITDGTTTNYDYSDGTIVILNNYQPTISLLQPNGYGDVSNTAYRIEWQASDPDATATTVSLYYYTSQQGANPTLIASGVPYNNAPMSVNTFSYVWNTTAIAAGNYYISATISDGVTPIVATPIRGPLLISHNANAGVADTFSYRIGSIWFQFFENQANSTYRRVRYGISDPTYTPLKGDWDGDGVDELAYYKNGYWFTMETEGSSIRRPFAFGPAEAGWQPVSGDWDGDGVDGVGVYKDGLFILKNTASTGSVEYRFRYGPSEAGWNAITGDWNGDGVDSPGLYQSGLFMLSDTLTNPNVNYRFRFGSTEAGWIPVAGDWNGDGYDSVGIYRSGRWYLTNGVTTATASIAHAFTRNYNVEGATVQPVVGKWNAALSVTAESFALSGRVGMTLDWSDNALDEDARVSIYLDDNNHGNDGRLVVADLSEDDTTDSYSWNATGVVTGDYYAYLVIRDASGTEYIDYSDTPVHVINSRPQITSNPEAFVYANSSYSYNLTGTDADNDPISYSLKQAPAGMTLNSGAIAWTPNTSAVGDHLVSIEISDGIVSNVQDLILTVDQVPVPVVNADFTASTTTGYAPLTVNFTSTSNSENTTITSWSWDFNNDGTIDSTAQNPSYQYNNPGTYTVKLTVSNGTISDLEMKTDWIVVSAVPTVTANFTADDTNGYAPFGVGFTDTSTAQNTAITSWSWDFNNDGTVDSTDKNGIYTYSAAGTYTVKLTVSNGTISDSEIKTGYIVVTPAHVVTAAFSANVTSGNAPLNVNFTNSSTAQNTTITNWQWDFDSDGIVDSTVQNPSHSYTAPGTYTVTLSVNDGDVYDDEIKTSYIVVNAPPVIPVCTLPEYTIADAYVRAGTYANNNYGSATTLYTKDGGTNYDRQSFIRFDLTAEDYDDIESAKLKIFIDSIEIASSTQPTITFYDVTNNTWTQSGIKWSNKPSFGSALVTWNVVNSQDETWLEIDLTSYVQAELDGDRIINIGTWDTNAANESVEFDSIESGNPAYLEITGASTECPPPAVEGDYELDRQVSSSYDDGGEDVTVGGDMMRTLSELFLTQAWGEEDFETAVRFQNVTIPQGATIVSAYIEFTAYETNGSPASLNIYAEDVDNSMALEYTDDNITNRSKTTNSVNWINLGSWTANSAYKSPNIASVIQEVVDRGGWTSGNSMMFILNGTGDRSVYSYNGSTTYAPKLHIEYDL